MQTIQLLIQLLKFMKKIINEQADKAIKSAVASLAVSEMYLTDYEIVLIKKCLTSEISEEKFKKYVLDFSNGAHLDEGVDI